MPALRLKRTCAECGKSYEWVYFFGSVYEAERKGKELLQLPGECLDCRKKRALRDPWSFHDAVKPPKSIPFSAPIYQEGKKAWQEYVDQNIAVVSLIQEAIDSARKGPDDAEAEVSQYYLNSPYRKEYEVLALTSYDELKKVLGVGSRLKTS